MTNLKNAMELIRKSLAPASTTMSLRAMTLIWILLAAGLARPAFAQSTPAKHSQAVEESVAAQLPALPPGFSWAAYRGVLFARPAGWNENQQLGKLLNAPHAIFAFSPEEFSVQKNFEMGMTIQIITEPKRLAGVEAKTLAIAMQKPTLDGRKSSDILMWSQNKQGDFDEIYFRYRDAPPGLKPIVVHNFIVANNTTDSLHIFTFESPESSWAENWAKYGTPILADVRMLHK